MVSSTLLTISLFNGIAFGKHFTGWSDAPAPTVAARQVVQPPAARGLTKCSANNCLNVMLNSPIPASSFCSGYIASTTVVTVTPTVTIVGTVTISPTIATPAPTASAVLVPSHISSQCALTTSPPLTSRLSSACSCLSITPSTVTSTSIAPTVTSLNPCGALPNPYTVPGGTFNIYCGDFVFGDAIVEYDGTITDMVSCMDACANTPGCIGIDWADEIEGVDPPITGCALLEDVDDYGYMIYNFAALSNYTLPTDLFDNLLSVE